jgi:PmbA protein
MEIESALNLLAKKASDAEIFCAKEHSRTLEIKGREIDLTRESTSQGYGIRVIVGKKMGFAFSNRLDEAAINGALGSAKIAEVDEHLSLPDGQEYGTGGGYDKEIEALDTETLLGFARDLVFPCKDYSVTPTTGSITALSYAEEIANTRGASGTDIGTTITAYLSTVAKDGDVATGFYYEVSRLLDLDFAGIGKEAAHLASSSLGAKKVGTLKTNIIMKPSAVTELFEHALLPSFSADNVQRGRSVLGGKLGEEIATGITLTDAGTLQEGLMSAKFDSEGVSSKETPLLKNGTLCGFLYDTYTANKGGTKSTGNASRDSFSSMPQVGPTNVIVSGGGEITEGLVVHGLIGAHTSNPVSGDFSCETRNAFLDGRPVKKAIISGNVFELIKNIEGFGKDVKQYSYIVSPSIQFSDVTVIG